MNAFFLKRKAKPVKTLKTVQQSVRGVSKHVKKTLHHNTFKDVLKSKSPLTQIVASINRESALATYKSLTTIL